MYIVLLAAVNTGEITDLIPTIPVAYPVCTLGDGAVADNIDLVPAGDNAPLLAVLGEQLIPTRILIKFCLSCFTMLLRVLIMVYTRGCSLDT